MQQEDIFSGFVAVITLVLNLIPSITGTTGILTPTESAGLLSLAVLLKAILGNITIGQPPLPAPIAQDVTQAVAPPVPVVPLVPISEVGTYAFTGTNPDGQPYSGTLTVGTTKAAAIASLTSLGFKNIVIGAKQ
jgi:hypothetical protein